MRVKKLAEAPHDFNVAQWRPTGDIRIRQQLFWAVCEEMWENKSGDRKWTKIPAPFSLQRGVLDDR
jgi:hypothetical protein